jgi:hypothetical protein
VYIILLNDIERTLAKDRVKLSRESKDNFAIANAIGHPLLNR